MRPRRNIHIEQKDPLALEIQAVLEDDLKHGAGLMLPEYRNAALKHGRLDGYCAAASAAFFFLGGGKDAGLQPMQLTRKGQSHWWILREGEAVIDLTLRPGEKTRYPYWKGSPRGFMQTGYKRPSQRAAELIDRVERRR